MLAVAVFGMIVVLAVLYGKAIVFERRDRQQLKEFACRLEDRIVASLANGCDSRFRNHTQIRTSIRTRRPWHLLTYRHEIRMVTTYGGRTPPESFKAEIYPVIEREIAELDRRVMVHSLIEYATQEEARCASTADGT